VEYFTNCTSKWLNIRAKVLSILYFASKPRPIGRGDKNMKDGMGFSPDSIIFIDERLFFLIPNFHSTVIIQSFPTKFAVEPYL